MSQKIVKNYTTVHKINLAAIKIPYKLQCFFEQVRQILK